MDKLQPILKFHFWILLFIALIMAFVGWWMTTGQMKGAITARRDKIKAAKDKIPADAASHPNKSWDDKLAAINAEQDKLIRYSREWLYARQKEAMVWPAWMPEPARKMKDANDSMDNGYRVIYRNNYIKEVLRVYQIPKPIQDPRDPNGVVIFPFSAMPHREWGDNTPSSKQVWESMEDLWLLEPILRAVDDTNGGKAANRQEASIVQIDYVRLHGGDRSRVGQSMDAGGGGGPMAGAAMAGPAAFGSGGDEASPGGRAGGNMALQGPSISDDINPLDEFGDPGMGDAGGGMDSEGGGGMPVMAGGDPRGMFGGGGGGGFSNSNEEVGRRYIDDETTQPFKTRGFKLTVVMDHRRVPDLYANLTSRDGSPWPIKIVRMSVADFKEGGSFSGGGGFGGGFGGGGDEDDRSSIIGPRAGAGVSNPFGGGANPFGGGAKPFGGGANPFGGGAAGFPGPAGAKGGPPSVPKAGYGIGNRDREDETMMSNMPQENPLERPYLARVTILGLISMYREPTQAEGAPSTGGQPGDAVAAEPPAAGDAAADDGTEAMTDEEAADLSAPSSLEGEDESMPAEETNAAGDADKEAATEDAGEDAGRKDEDPEMKSDDEASPAADPSPEVPTDDAGAPGDSGPADEKQDQGE